MFAKTPTRIQQVPYQERKDSFSTMGTPCKRDSPPFKMRPKNELRLVIPQRPTAPPRALGAGPQPSNEQLMVEIEGGLKAMRYTDEKDPSSSTLLSTASKPLKHHSSIRRMASAASGQLQKRFSLTSSHSEARDNIESRSSSLPSRVAVASNTEPEFIVDPNGLISSPRPWLHRPAALRSNSKIPLPLPKPPHSKHSQAEVIEQLPTSPASPGHRLAMEMERKPDKAIRVLGPFDVWKEIEAKQEKERKKVQEKERKQAKKRRRLKEILEVASKALELG
jgi:hypothetical protein